MKTNNKVQRVNNIERPAAYWETLTERIRQSMALRVLIDTAEGRYEPTDKQLKAAMFLVNKVPIPTFQAMSIEVNSQKPQTIQDVEAKLSMLGISPSSAWDMLTNQPEKKEESPEHLDHPHPRESES